MKRALAAVFVCCLAGQGAAGCDPAPDPVIALDHGSRYRADDPTRSIIDTESNAAVEAALRPVDDFMRNLIWHANAVTRGGSAESDRADCVVARLAVWARADALSDLGSLTAQLAVGGRLAGFAEAYRQVHPLARSGPDAQAVEEWLARRAGDQMEFWERDATNGARRGNLRAWASLAIFLVGDLTGDDAARFWAIASAARILCSARGDGSLPQETGRGKWALHYQFHAIAPLVAMAARSALNGPDLTRICDGALGRAVRFAMTDYLAGGEATERYSAQVQTYFDGTQVLEPHAVAWLRAWLWLSPGDAALATEVLARVDGTPVNSRLGGDPSLFWPPP